MSLKSILPRSILYYWPRLQQVRPGSFYPKPAGYTPQSADMADKKPSASEAPFAKRIDPAKADLSQEQLHFIRQVELEQWRKNTQKLRTRNVVTGLAIGAMVMGIYGYTFWSVSQERIMDEIDEEAKRARTQTPKTGAN